MRTARFSKAGALCLALGPGILLSSAATGGEDWVPVYEEPRHRLVFENDEVMILDVDLPPGDVSLYHRHQLDFLYVHISGAKVWARPLGGEKRFADVPTGSLRFSSDNHELPHIHQVGNVGDTPFQLIAVGVKGAASGRADPIEGDLAKLQLVTGKRHASAWQINLAPGESSGKHRHHLPFTRVFLTGGTLREENGEMVEVKAGDYRWFPGGDSHKYENAGTEAMQIVEVQAQ